MKKKSRQPLSWELEQVAKDARLLRINAESTAEKAHQLHQDIYEMEQSQHQDLERIKQEKPRVPARKSSSH